MKPWILLGLLLCAVAAHAAEAERGRKETPKGGIDKKTAGAIEQAIAKGSAWLRVQPELPFGIQHQALTIPMTLGRSALLGLALLESGVPTTDVQIQSLWSRLQTTPPSGVYEAGVSLMFAEAYLRAQTAGKRRKHPDPDPAVRAWMQKLADYLASGCYGGVWTYTCPGGKGYPVEEMAGKGYRIGGIGGGDAGEQQEDADWEDLREAVMKGRSLNPRPGDHDHSNTQYAVLGLKAASLCGVKVANARLMWRTVIYHFLDAQEASGPEVDLQLARDEGRYKVTDYATESGPTKPQARGWHYMAYGQAYGTMTAAGITALRVAQSEVPDLSRRERAAVNRAVRDALAWFQLHWSVEKNPEAPEGFGQAPFSHYYHLYGLERIGVLTSVSAIAGHAWYREGAEILLKQQKADGSWGEMPGVPSEETGIKTAFALLFLARSTQAEYAGYGVGER